MAFTLAGSNLPTIESFVGALYGYAVGSATMTQVNADITTYGGLNAALNAYYTAGFSSMTTANVAKTIVANVGLGTDANAIAYVTGQLNTAAPAARGAAVANILNAFTALTADPTYGAAATAWNSKVATSVSYASANVGDATLSDAAQAVAVANSVGKTFTLTAGVDTFVGSAATDTFNAPAGTLSGLDKLVGNGGGDSLNIAATAAFVTPSGLSVSGIDNVNISSTAAVDINTNSSFGFTGVKNLSVATNSAAATAKADPSTSIVVTDNAAGANNAITVDGGNNVTITATGSTLTTETIGVGATVAPKGNVTISQSTATTNAAGSTVTVKGGSAVAIDQVIKNTAITNTATNGAISVTGTADTLSVTVTQSAPVTVTGATNASAGVNNAVVAVGGVASSAVTIADLNAGSPTLPGTITAVTLKNYDNSTISSSALNTLTLSGTGVDTAGRSIATGTLGLTDGLATPTVTTLTMNLGGGSLGAISDNSAKFTTLNAVMSANTTLAASTFNALKTININGSGVLSTTIPATVTAVTVAGAGGFSGTLPAGVTSFDATGSTAAETVTLTNSNLQTYKGGSGVDTVTITSNPTKVIDGGDGKADVLTLGSIASTATYFTAANAGANVKNFEIFASGTGTSGTVDLAAFAANNTFTTVKFKNTGSVTLNNVPTGANVEISSSSTAPATPSAGTNVVNYADYSGWTDSSNVKLNGAAAVNGAGNAYLGTGTVGYVTTALTLQDAAGTGIANVTFDSNGTVAGSFHTITTLTDTYLSNLVIGGTAGLTITGLTVSSPSLKITDNDTSTGASAITTLTAASLANLAYSGSKAFSTAIANDAAAAVTISNTNTGSTGVLTVNSSALNSAATINLQGSVAATLTSSLNGSQKVVGGTDNQAVSITASSGGVKTITLGNGANTVVTGAGADVITLGNGANTVTPGAGADTVNFDISHTGIDTVVYGATGQTASTAVSNGATVISVATGFDIINGMHAGDKIDLTALTAAAYTAAATAVLTSIMTGGTNGDIALVRGNYNTVTGYFTTSSSGADTLVQWDNDGTGAGTTVESILLVGFANTGSTSTNDGLITLA